MILLLAVLLGLTISLIRYRDRALDRIASIPLQGAWLALVAIVLQWPLLGRPGGSTQHLVVPQILFLLSHLLLLVFVWRNRKQIGILVVGVGIVCNLLGISINDGFMPISPETLAQINPGSTWEQWPLDTHYGNSKDIIRLQEETRLWVLSDILVLPPPFPRPTAFSLGDLLIATGVLVFLQGGISQPYAAGSQFS
jgi:hypothetical protein